jgi:hypothetical protein
MKQNLNGKKMYKWFIFLILDLIFRFLAGFFLSPIYLQNSDNNSRSDALIAFSFIVFLLFSSLVENILIYLFSKYVKNLSFNQLNIGFTGLFFWVYFYLFYIKNRNINKLSEFLFLVSIMLIGATIRVFFNKVYEDK